MSSRERVAATIALAMLLICLCIAVLDVGHFLMPRISFVHGQGFPKAASSQHDALISGVAADNLIRLKHLRRFCKTKRNLSEPKLCGGQQDCNLQYLRPILVDEKHKLIYCAIPKVASTTLKNKLVHMIDADTTKKVAVHARKVISRFGIYGLQTYTRKQIEYRLKHYFKFIFVRHPLIRLLSAYTNKIEKNKGTTFYGKQMKPDIDTYVRKNSSTPITDTAISFEEFASLITHYDTTITHNVHWNTFEKLCSPCEIQYDFIGRQESFFEETEYLFRSRLGILKGHPSNNKGHVVKNSLSQTRKYYKQLSEETKKAVLRRFGDDIEMFGYNSADILL